MPRLSLVPAALACGLGLGLAASAQAQTSLTLYGLLDLNVGSFQNAGGSKTAQVSNGDFSTSYLGFSGTEDLGGGLSAKFALESFFRPDSGKAARVSNDTATNADVFWARAANVGLSSSSVGGITLGRSTTTLFISTLIFNPFGDSFGFSPSIRPYYTKELIGDSGWSNSITYNSPNFSGLSFALQGNLGEGGANSVGKNFGGHVLYFGGPFAATIAVQKVKNTSDTRFSSAPLTGLGFGPGFQSQTAWQLGGSYDAGVVKVYGQYGQVTTDLDADRKAKISQIGVSVPVGAGAILASFGYDKVTEPLDASYKTLTLAYDYNLSKRTDVYGVYMNEKKSNFLEFNGSELSGKGNTFAVGIRHKF